MGEPDVVPAAFEAAPALSEEEVASRLRGFRTATNRQLLDIAQLDDYDDELAATIRRRPLCGADDDVEAVITFFSQGTPQFIVAMLLACTAGGSRSAPTPSTLVAVAVFAFWCVQVVDPRQAAPRRTVVRRQVHGGHHLAVLPRLARRRRPRAAWFSAVAAIAAAAAFLSVLAPCRRRSARTAVRRAARARLPRHTPCRPCSSSNAAAPHDAPHPTTATGSPSSSPRSTASSARGPNRRRAAPRGAGRTGAPPVNNTRVHVSEPMPSPVMSHVDPRACGEPIRQT